MLECSATVYHLPSSKYHPPNIYCPFNNPAAAASQLSPMVDPNSETARIVAESMSATGVEAWYNGIQGRQLQSDNSIHPRANNDPALVLTEAEMKYPTSSDDLLEIEKRRSIQQRRADVLYKLNQELEKQLAEERRRVKRLSVTPAAPPKK